MSAREKLNGVYITMCFVFAGLIGGSAGCLSASFF